MRYLIILLMLLLVACPKGGGTSEQPYLRIEGKDIYKTVPPVVGKWSKSPTYTIDYHIYDYPGENIIVPVGERDKAETFLKKIFPPIQSSFLSYNGQPIQSSFTTGTADITIRFYYGKWYSPKSSSNVEDYLKYIREMKQDFIVVEKETSSSHDTPPTWRSNYNGLTYTSSSGGKFKKITVWINAYPWFDLKDRPNGEQLTADYIRDIIWHEYGHAYWGLNDDTVGTYPGLMVYRAMAQYPSDIEWPVVLWNNK
jgi:hypothetical protein